MQPTPEQVAAYRRDGFLVVERFLADDEVERLRERFAACFNHEWETGLRPDEVNYDPKSTPPDLTRQLCNAWKSDRTVAATVLAERNAAFGAALAGVPGLRLAQDNLIWKPPAGKALLCHQDAAYLDFLDPKNMTTCWMALDDTAADTGTIYYVKGSNHWPHADLGGEFHAPDDWLAHARGSMPEGAELELVPIEVPAGGAAFHDGWTFHGSPSNERDDRERRAMVSHMISTETRWNPAHAHGVYSKYRRPGELELDEAFFPVMWREDGHRTPWIDTEFAPRPVAA
jgi:ectoine hydroxylase-related dioxygenase (phytanoyl-CoA dioxygenase family)